MYRNLFKILSKGLDAETRTAIAQRAEKFMRDIRYEMSIQSPVFRSASEAGWSLSQLDAISVLNAFYQIVLGPLAAASRPNLQVGLVREIPVAYGAKVRVTEASAAQIRACHDVFMAIVEGLELDLWCMQSAHANDMLYKLGHAGDAND